MAKVAINPSNMQKILTFCAAPYHSILVLSSYTVSEKVKIKMFEDV